MTDIPTAEPDALLQALQEANDARVRSLVEIERLRAEIERLRGALDRRNQPLSQEWLTKLHDRAHRQPSNRVWRIVDTLVHHVDRLSIERDQTAAVIGRVREALRYIACPTMGYDLSVSPRDFAAYRVTEQNARMALALCIENANAALALLDPPCTDEARSILAEAEAARGRKCCAVCGMGPGYFVHENAHAKGYHPFSPSAEPTPAPVVLTRRRCAGTAPYVGRPFHYEWWAARDEYGRCIAGDVRRVEHHVRAA